MTGSVLDVAGGTGRNALWLAARGFAVTLTDVSAVGLEVARTEATRRRLEVETVELDLELKDCPPGPWDLILCFHYLKRSLFAVFPTVLRPAGMVVGELATVRNLERHENPRRQFLLEEGELPGLVQELDLVMYTEGWTETDQHLARLVARKPAG